MSTYVIGDVQGCFEPLMDLVEAINFNPQKDQLIFCGDLVNRGGRSLDVLRWVYAHQKSCDSVLGNHDLSLLRKFFSKNKFGRNKEFNQVFKASDAGLLMGWLLNRPFHIKTTSHVIVHAGIYPFWTYKQFKSLSLTTQQEMLDDPDAFFASMYGNTPKKWSDDLPEMDQCRFVVNACTRMRFVKRNGVLNFTENKMKAKMKTLYPWFKLGNVTKLKKHVIFGHWSALGYYHDNNVTCLDSGKVWGGQLTALRLEDQSLIRV